MESVPLPSPSAFPALPLHNHNDHATHESTHESNGAHSAVGGEENHPHSTPTLSYARASKTNLPPTKAPEGISLPPQQPTAGNNKNSNGIKDRSSRQDSSSAKGGPPAVKSGSSSSAARKPAKPRQQSNSASHQQQAASSTNAAAKRPRTVPGMPASMLPPVANKKAKHKSNPSQSSAAATPAPASTPVGGEIPSVGKKRRQTLRKTLPPTASKLSALAASFDFVPRGAPSLPSAAAVSDAPEPTHANGAAAGEGDQKQDGGSDGSPQHDDDNEAAAHPEQEGTTTSTDSEPASSSKDDKTHSATGTSLTADNAAAIHETVASAGAQGDEFRSQSFSTADAQGAAEAQGTEPGLQSASARKPVSAGSAPEPERKKENKATLEVVDTGEKKSLGGFLGEAFVAANGEFAPLDLPTPAAAEEEEEVVDSNGDAAVKVTTIPGAVEQSPVADLSWREKKGWWSPSPNDYDPAASASASASTTPLDASPNPDPHVAGPAAVEPAQSQTVSKDEILLRFPPWKPESTSSASEDQKPAKEMVKAEEIKPLAEFLPRAFVAQPSDDEGEKASSPAVAKGKKEASSSPSNAAGDARPASPALSSFLSGSFSATGSPTPLEAPATVSVGEDEVPLNAEAIVSQPPLSDILDVDAIENGKVVEHVDGKGAEKEGEEQLKPKEKKHGWWSSGYVPPEQASAESPFSTRDDKSSSSSHENGTGLVDENLVQETVGSAGAQGDRFTAQSYSSADSQGVAQLEPTPASAQSAAPKPQQKKDVEAAAAAPAATAETKDAIKEVERQQEEEPERASTPIGHFLGQAFSSRPADRVVAEHQRDDTETETSESSPAASSSSANGSSSSSTLTPRASTTSTETAPPAASTPALRRRSSSPSPPPSPRRSSSHNDQQQPPHHSADEAPSLTLAIASAWHTAPWSRKLWAVLASVAINVGLPFVNGVMLGFGELFARNVLGVRLGWPLAASGSSSQPQGSSQRANTSSVGLRAAGSNSSVGREVPGHAGAKTAAEAVVEGARELSE
ncbi:hypothetical protein JCM10908_005250 [Rhodotorula pacifica]|uniref:uncharacterized protein n=1 Tax=Rhodotorula pacifica TaxID=1495444 RepID=UPI0031730FCD